MLARSSSGIFLLLLSPVLESVRRKLAIFHARLRFNTGVVDRDLSMIPSKGYRCRGYARKTSCFSFGYTTRGEKDGKEERKKGGEEEEGTIRGRIRDQCSRHRSFLVNLTIPQDLRNQPLVTDTTSRVMQLPASAIPGGPLPCRRGIWLTFLSSIETNASSVCLSASRTRLTFRAWCLYLSRFHHVIVSPGRFTRYRTPLNSPCFLLVKQFFQLVPFPKHAIDRYAGLTLHDGESLLCSYFLPLRIILRDFRIVKYEINES